jgi:hypothetical protein
LDFCLSDFFSQFGQLDFHQFPKNFTIKSIQQKLILVESNGHNFIMNHERNEHFKSSIIIKPAHQQVASDEIESLGVADFGEVNCEFF